MYFRALLYLIKKYVLKYVQSGFWQSTKIPYKNNHRLSVFEAAYPKGNTKCQSVWICAIIVCDLKY